ncbi:MAG: ATP-dependent Clp protease ATP-binding subunit, partial [Oscillospiraceae bacterium]|nr:ATP-dependent Clp protease ATP-binding subunit [Oscillospiraceae bacterium]
YSVVLFDEIEKAHEDVFNILLQIMDDGRLTDSQGRRVDFKNTIIVMTSNVGAQKITDGQKKLGFDLSEKGDSEKEKSELRAMVMGDLKRTFRPEFLNRIDDIIVFDRLGRENIVSIARNMLAAVAERTASLGIELYVSDEAAEYLAEKGYDPAYGARPLRRTIQSMVEDAIAEKMLDSELRSGDKALCTVAEGKLSVEKEEK